MPWLDNARITAIFAVVLLHTTLGAVVDTPLGSASWWAGNLYNASSRWCVPVFVMISGALLLNPARDESPGRFYRKRMARILVPFLFWSLFFLGWTLAKGIAKGSPPSLLQLGQRLVTGDPYYHLWFLYMLLPLYAVTPVLRRLVARATRPALVTLTALGFGLAALTAVLLHPGGRGFFPTWFLSYLPYLLLGHLIATDPRPLPGPVAAGVLAATSLLTAAGCYGLARGHGLGAGLYFYDYLSVTVIPMSVGAMYLFRAWRPPLAGAVATPRLAALTMGVYLIHPLFLEVLQRIGLGPLDFPAAVAIPLVALAVFGASLAATALLGRLPLLRRTI